MKGENTITPPKTIIFCESIKVNNSHVNLTKNTSHVDIFYLVKITYVTKLFRDITQCHPFSWSGAQFKTIFVREMCFPPSWLTVETPKEDIIKIDIS
jgi:hypothetical protein